MGYEMPKQINQETNPENSVNFFDFDNPDITDKVLDLKDLSYQEVEELKEKDPDLYDELIEKHTKALEDLERRRNQEVPESALDNSHIDRLYEKEDGDYMRGQN